MTGAPDAGRRARSDPLVWGHEPVWRLRVQRLDLDAAVAA
jgi:hypothetical protein